MQSVRFRNFGFLLALASIAVAAGCDDVFRGLSRDYGQCITGGEERHLSVTCLNSPFAERPAAERANTARKVAEYVRDHDPKYKAAEDVTVRFLSKKESAKGDAKHARATYTFRAAELGTPAP
jgi:hypothetical protein